MQPKTRNANRYTTTKIYLHGALGLVLGIMRNVGRSVEQFSHPVTTVRGDDRALGGLGHRVDRLT